MPRKRSLAAVALLLASVAGWAEQTRLPKPPVPPAASEPSPNDPAMETFNRAVAIQATPIQVGYFQAAIESTDIALQQSRELHGLEPGEINIPNMNARSLKLRDVVDDVEHYNAIFLASFSKMQEAELKPLTKRLRKSYPAVTREAKAVSQQLEPGKTSTQRLKSASANLEKALSDFRSDQIRLGREMGIQSK